MPLLNTGTSHADLTGVFISDLVLQILAYVAETERSFIRQRQAEGIAIAKANGVKFGAENEKFRKNFPGIILFGKREAFRQEKRPENWESVILHFTGDVGNTKEK